MVEQGFAIPLEGDLKIEEIIAIYEKFFKEEKLVYNDMVQREQLKNWFREPGSFEKWFQELEEKAWNHEERRKIYEQELIIYKLQKLPERKLIY